MARKQKRVTDDTTEVLKDLLIVQLGVAGVRQRDIRAIVGVDMNRVSRIVRHIKPRPSREDD